MNNKASSLVKMIAAMTIFGTIGIFRSYIPCSSATLAFVRGIIGMLFLICIMAIGRKKISFGSIKKALLLLSISGALIGLNWILLFESYRYTTVSTATLCYYMAPIFVIIASSPILREKLTPRKLLCTLCAISGMIIISGVFTDGNVNLYGIAFGLGAAALYASVIMINKFISGISDYERTVVQLGMAAFAVFPYLLFTEDFSSLDFTPKTVLLLIFVGILHTGIAYTLYFGSLSGLKAQTAAIFSYIDPVVALLLSALILKEGFTLLKLTGSLLILGAALVCELPSDIFKKIQKKNNKTT